MFDVKANARHCRHKRRHCRRRMTYLNDVSAVLAADVLARTLIEPFAVARPTLDPVHPPL